MQRDKDYVETEDRQHGMVSKSSLSSPGETLLSDALRFWKE